ncbi:unnamed protein product [Cuscuta campestris]|uniref:Uncharacterized protein n=1 Tax=Cuscuta campestris TaxID=132261 RepID=A0A484MJQ6_9ASTE|nr:unnamed protein product [Cuscuta campestris]
MKKPVYCEDEDEEEKEEKEREEKEVVEEKGDKNEEEEKEEAVEDEVLVRVLNEVVDDKDDGGGNWKAKYMNEDLQTKKKAKQDTLKRTVRSLSRMLCMVCMKIILSTPKSML